MFTGPGAESAPSGAESAQGAVLTGQGADIGVVEGVTPLEPLVSELQTEVVWGGGKGLRVYVRMGGGCKRQALSSGESRRV